MPQKGKPPLTRSQKLIIAGGKLLGRPNKETAQRAGVSLTTVAHAASRPDIRSLMARLAERYEAEHQAMYEEALAGIRQDLGAEEWQARAEARRQALAIIAAGDRAREPVGGQGQPSQGAQYTLTEVWAVLRQATAGAPEGEPT